MALQCELLINERVQASEAYIRVLQVFVNLQQKAVDVLLAVYDSAELRKEDVVDKAVKLNAELEAIKVRKLSAGKAQDDADKAYVEIINQGKESPELWQAFKEAQAVFERVQIEEHNKQREIESVFGEQPLLTKMTFPMAEIDFTQPIIPAVYSRIKNASFNGVMDNKKIEMDFTGAQDV